jgi:hypothetical protein
MESKRPLRACLWLRVSTDTKGQDPELQRADLDRVCQQRGWEVIKVYEVEESAFGKTPREQIPGYAGGCPEGQVRCASVVSLKRLNNKATRVIPAKAGIQKVRTVDSVSSTE